MKAVTDFARKTGDLAALSKVDLRVLALTYTLEAQHVGTSHLRTELVKATPRPKPKPVVEEKGVAATPPASAEDGVSGEEPVVGAKEEQEESLEMEGVHLEGVTEGEEGSEEESGEEEGEEEYEEGEEVFFDDEDGSEEDEGEEVQVESGDLSTEEAPEPEQRGEEEDDETPEAPAPQPEQAPAPAQPQPKKAFSWADAVKKEVPDGPVVRARKAPSGPAIPLEDVMASLSPFAEATSTPSLPPKASASGDVTSRVLGAGGTGMDAKIDDDGEGWIHVGNLREARSKGQGFFGGIGACRGAPLEQEEAVPVACVTTDFAMQNVMLQVGEETSSVSY